MKSKKFLVGELKKLFKKELNMNVKENNKIYNTENWDSVGNFNLLLSVEKKFKIKFNKREFNNLNSFKEILKSVANKIK